MWTQKQKIGKKQTVTCVEDVLYMFGKKKNENVVVVTTKEELEAAIKSKKPNIEVRGSLAKKIKWMAKLNRAAIIALVPLLVVAGGTTGGLAAGLAIPAGVAATGITGGQIVACALSASVIIAIIKGYNVEVDAKGIVRLTK